MAVEVFDTVARFRAECERVRSGGRRLGLVPTMGALHDGHLSLIGAAARRAEVVAVTIFVNPTQFGPTEDFAKYPRTLEADVAASERAGATLVFAPGVREMYPDGETTRVRVGELTEHICGRSRPGHFEGVATVVTKLFAVAGPCVAVFGRKDYQQLKVIERMTRDLLLPVEVIGCPIVREADGLALSSRNRYLSAPERGAALAIPRALSTAAAARAGGERRVAALRTGVERALADGGLRVDYAVIADPERLVPLEDAGEVGARALLAVAAFAGTTRLIDNLVLGEDPAPLPRSAP